MYLLYLDESGNPDDAGDRHFVLGGVAVFERQTYFLSQGLDAIQTKFFPGVQPVEFHASAIRSGSGFWRRTPQQVRHDVLREVGGAIVGIPSAGLVCFAAVVEKTDHLRGEAAVRRATEEVCRRFDIFLMRQAHEHDNPQRGLLVLAEGRFHQRGRVWVQGFRNLGTQWGVLRNLSDIPYFASTRETRLLQAADYVSHAAFLLYERRDPALIQPILPRFDQTGGTIHGLAHVARGRATCDCPACSSRRSPGDFGRWHVVPE